ncbi:hypothetical protein AAVH_17562 [Aphelenchoides avenae]|nr:hypothetical protein AAVH_17562 [Aphelenchus avenae]
MPTKAADLELLRRLEMGIQQARRHLAQKIAIVNAPEQKPRVARRYDHNCFFTPMNCMVGRTPSSSSFVQIGGHIIPAKVLLE